MLLGVWDGVRSLEVRCFLGCRGSPQGCGYAGGSLVLGSVWGETHIPLFHAGGRQDGAGTAGDPQQQVFGWEGRDRDDP